MDRRDLLERLHTLSHYVNRGKDFNWRAGPLANESVGDGRLLISLDVDAAQFWGLYTELQERREQTRKQRQIESGQKREQARQRSTPTIKREVRVLHRLASCTAHQEVV